MGHTTSPVARLAHRAGCTEGQAYTATLALLLAAVVVLFGIPAERRLGAAPSGVETTVPTTTAVASPATSTSVVDRPLTTTAPTSAVPPGTGAAGQPTPGPTAPPPGLNPDPCEGNALAELGDQLADQLREATGGAVTGDSVRTALGVAAGCDPAGPVGVVLSLLTEVGAILPDLGLPPLNLPPISLPDLGPITGPIASPVCKQADAVVPLLLLLAGDYPEPAASLLVILALQTYATCGAAGG